MKKIKLFVALLVELTVGLRMSGIHIVAVWDALMDETLHLVTRMSTITQVRGKANNRAGFHDKLQAPVIIKCTKKTARDKDSFRGSQVWQDRLPGPAQ